MNSILDRAQIEMLRQIPGNTAPTLFEEVAAAYLASADTHFQEARDAHRQQDWPALAKAVHKIKGSGSNFGGTELREVAEGIEAAVRAGQAPDEAAMARFFLMAEQLRDAVRVEYGKERGEEHPSGPASA